MLEKLAKLGLTTQSFEDVPRVIVRWLGRLLPENKWVFSRHSYCQSLAIIHIIPCSFLYYFAIIGYLQH